MLVNHVNFANVKTHTYYLNDRFSPERNNRTYQIHSNGFKGIFYDGELYWL